MLERGIATIRTCYPAVCLRFGVAPCAQQGQVTVPTYKFPPLLRQSYNCGGTVVA